MCSNQLSYQPTDPTFSRRGRSHHVSLRDAAEHDHMRGKGYAGGAGLRRAAPAAAGAWRGMKDRDHERVRAPDTIGILERR